MRTMLFLQLPSKPLLLSPNAAAGYSTEVSGYQRDMLCVYEIRN
jgi:hypothetical protein